MPVAMAGRLVGLQGKSAANQSNRQAFKLESFAGLHHDGLEVWVFGQQLYQILVAVKAFDRNFVAQPGDYDLPVLGFPGLLDCQQVAVHDACALHAHAAHLEQVVRLLFKHRAFEMICKLDMFLRKNGAACSNPAHKRQRQLCEFVKGR